MPTDPALAPMVGSQDPSKRSGGLTAFLVIAIILGGLGTLFGIFSMYQTTRTEEQAIADARKQTEAMNKLIPAPLTEEAKALQQEMIVASMKAVMAVRPYTIAYAVSNALLSIALLSGAILVLRRSEKGRKLLSAASLAHLPYEVLYVVVTWKTSAASTSVMGEYVEKLHRSMQPAGKAPFMDTSAVTSSAMKIGFYAGVAGAVGLALGLVVYYLLLWRQLQKDSVKSYCRD